MSGALTLVLLLCAPQIAGDVVAEARKLIDDGQPQKAIAALQSVKTDGDAGLLRLSTGGRVSARPASRTG